MLLVVLLHLGERVSEFAPATQVLASECNQHILFSGRTYVHTGEQLELTPPFSQLHCHNQRSADWSETGISFMSKHNTVYPPPLFPPFLLSILALSPPPQPPSCISTHGFVSCNTYFSCGPFFCGCGFLSSGELKLVNYLKSLTVDEIVHRGLVTRRFSISGSLFSGDLDNKL